MTETNGEAYTIRRGNRPIAPENLTTGAPSQSYYYGLTGEVPEPVSPRRQRPGPRKQVLRRETQRSASPESRAAFRCWWKNAQKAAASMELAATGQDLMQLANAADELDIALAELWKLRSTRDINWHTILNHVQGMVRQAFAEKRIEQLTPGQCAAIRAIVDRHLGTSTKSVDDLNEVVELIEEAGFDPYGAISGDPLNEQGQEPQE
jgi:hypothetical protein